jgi:TM2 domain-containing membrane protein YozV
MKCYVHPEVDAVGTCVSCHKAICSDCVVEVSGKLFCRECLASGKNKSYQAGEYDPNTAFLLELVGGLFGLLGIGYFYVGRTNDGIIRLIIFLLYNITAWIVITLLTAIIIGCFFIPVQIVIQVGVAVWSANTLKKDLMQDTMM